MINPFQAISRRTFLASSAALAAGWVSGCKSSASDAREKQLRMFSYAGPSEEAYRKALVPAFEKATGTKIIVSPGWWEAIPQVKSSPPDQPPYDLVMTDATQGYPAIREGLFQKIDFSEVPHAQSFAPRILNNWVYREGWGLPQVGPAMSLVWNTKLLPQGLKRWSDLFAEPLKGRIMLYNSHYMSLYTFAVAKVEMDGKPGTATSELENNLDGVLRFASEKSSWVRYWWPSSGDASNALLQQNVAAGNAHGSALVDLIRQGQPVDLTVPLNDRVWAPSFLVIPHNTKKSALARAAIDFYARPDIQRAMVVESGGLHGCNIPDVAIELAKDNPVWARVFPSELKHFEDLSYYPFELYERHYDTIKNFWERQVLRQV